MIIDGKHIMADKDKVLYCLWDNKLYEDFWLGKVYYKGGEKLDIPYEITVSDFTEISKEEASQYEIIEDKAYDLRGLSYAQIKTFIIKLHYSNDDQIAIMLNNDEDKMNEMQEWREYATIIAKKYTN